VNHRWRARFDTIRRRLDRLEQFAFGGTDALARLHDWL
jgi:hypothetical protein